MKKQIISLLIAVIILTSCTSTPPKSGNTITQPDTPAIAMGRYIEKDISPNFSQQDYLLRGSVYPTIDNNIVLHTYGFMCQTYINKDGVWNEEYIKDDTRLKPVSQKYLGKDVSWFYSEENAKPYIRESIVLGGEIIGPDGYTFASCYYWYNESYSQNSELIPEKHKREDLVASYNGIDAKYYDIPELLPPLDISQESMRYTYSRISRQNVLIASNQDGYLFYDLSVEGGKKLGILPQATAENASRKPVAFIADTVAVALDDSVELYSLATGEKIAQVELANVQDICEGVDGTFYALNKEGIWRILLQGGILQRVLDGSSYSFSSPAFEMKDFVQDKDGNFYILATKSNKPVLYKYEFSINTPLERETTLHLWAMKDSPTVRESVAEFMRANKEVKIYVEIAPADISVDNAMSNLTSTLLAGTGPDIIITDGLDLNKLDAQSVLAPISSEVDLLSYDHRLLPCGQIGNKQIAIPTRLFSYFTDPYDKSINIDAPLSLDKWVNTLKMSQGIEQLREKAGENNIFYSIASFSSRDKAYDAIYASACAELYKDGFNEEVASTVLQILKEIDTKFISETEEYSRSSLNPMTRATNVAGSYNNYIVQPIGFYGKANLVASRMVAYSANTQNADLCEAFINTMLSDYIQGVAIDDGQATTKIVRPYDIIGTDRVDTYFALDCLLIARNKLIELPRESIQIITENYTRDDAFKAIAFDYLDGKFDLDKALEDASKI